MRKWQERPVILVSHPIRRIEKKIQWILCLQFYITQQSMVKNGTNCVGFSQRSYGACLFVVLEQRKCGTVDLFNTAFSLFPPNPGTVKKIKKLFCGIVFLLKFTQNFSLKMTGDRFLGFESWTLFFGMLFVPICPDLSEWRRVSLKWIIQNNKKIQLISVVDRIFFWISLFKWLNSWFQWTLCVTKRRKTLLIKLKQ